MKLIIAGSRFITRAGLVEIGIKHHNITDITEVVCGMARGVDTLGYNWAKENGIPIKEFPAAWDTFGNRAGPIRNAEMANYADEALVIWDRKSPGSKNMIMNMKKRNKTYYEVVVP